MLKKPIAVVRLVSITGVKLIRRLSMIADRLSRPCRSSWKNVMKMWILSATAKVMIMTGALIIGVLRLYPYQPISPIAPMIENITTDPVTNVA